MLQQVRRRVERPEGPGRLGESVTALEPAALGVPVLQEQEGEPELQRLQAPRVHRGLEEREPVGAQEMEQEEWRVRDAARE